MYCICDYGNVDSLIEYKSTLATVSNIIDFENFDDIIAVGDFNADPNKGRFYSEFDRFCNDKHLHKYDIDFMPNDSYTYISSNEVCSTSWLDHVICSDTGMISNYAIGYGVTFDDHLPLFFNVKVSDIEIKYLPFSSALS